MCDPTAQVNLPEIQQQWYDNIVRSMLTDTIMRKNMFDLSVPVPCSVWRSWTDIAGKARLSVAFKTTWILDGIPQGHYDLEFCRDGIGRSSYYGVPFLISVRTYTTQDIRETGTCK